MAAPPPAEPPPDLEATPPALPTELLELIFLGSSHADLARISAACVSFRGLIRNQSFLRRHRALHPPLLLGSLCGRFQSANRPHPGARAGCALAREANFAFNDYLPQGRWRRWECRDVRDGRVLLFCGPHDWRAFAFPDLAVCRLLPLIRDHLIASAQLETRKIHHLEVLLVPSSGHHADEETSFKVIGRTHGAEKAVIFVFSSDTDRWNFGASISWDDLKAAGLSLPLSPLGCIPLTWAQYDHGYFYWKLDATNNLIKLDVNEMVFSTMNLPADHTSQDVAIWDVGEGRLAMLSLTPFTAYVNHYTTIMQNGGDSATDEWQLENVVPLPCRCTYIGALEGYVFLLSCPFTKEETMVGTACYSLDVKTLKLERVHRMDVIYGRIHLYFGFPPCMSPQRI